MRVLLFHCVLVHLVLEHLCRLESLRSIMGSSCKATKKSEAGLWCALLRGAVDGDQAEGHRIALLPLKIVHQTPVAVAPDRDTVVQAILHARERAADEFHAAGIVRDRDTVFRDDQIALEFLGDPAQDVLQGLGVELDRKSTRLNSSH